MDPVLVIMLSNVHLIRICEEDSIYEVTCCSRPIDGHQSNERNNDYDLLSAVGIEVFFRYTNESSTEEHEDGDDDNSEKVVSKFNANDIAKSLMNQSLFSVLNVNECLIVSIQDIQLVCRVSKVCVVRNSDDVALANSSSADVSLQEPYRGRVNINTEFYVEASNPDALHIVGGKTLPEGDLPEDAIVSLLHIYKCCFEVPNVSSTFDEIHNP